MFQYFRGIYLRLIIVQNFDPLRGRYQKEGANKDHTQILGCAKFEKYQTTTLNYKRAMIIQKEPGGVDSITKLC